MTEKKAEAKTYELAVNLLKLGTAWRKAAAAMKDLDVDLTTDYPFFLLDFELLTDSVRKWTQLNAGWLLQSIPDLLPKPVCLKCNYAFAALNDDGMCPGCDVISCSRYPVAPFDESTVRMFFAATLSETKFVTTETLFEAYQEYVNEQRQKKTEAMQ